MRTYILTVGILGSLWGFLWAAGPAFADNVPICQPGSDLLAYTSCKFSVRALEYANRHWYPQAIQKAIAAHLLDFSNAARITSLAGYNDTFSGAIKNMSLAQFMPQFPELEIETGDGMVQYGAALLRSRDLENNALNFILFSKALLAPTTWHDRIAVGNAQVGAIRGAQLANFVRYLDFVITDLDLATDYNLSGATPGLSCAFFLPFQFGITKDAVMPLVLATSSYPASSGCRDEGYRAILIQALTVNGGNLVDSNANPILFEDNGTAQALTNPGPVLQNEIADPKITRAFVDSVEPFQNLKGSSDITATELDRIVDRVNALFSNLGVLPDQQIAFYTGAISYARQKTSLIPLRMGARFADEVKRIGGRK